MSGKFGINKFQKTSSELIHVYLTGFFFIFVVLKIKSAVKQIVVSIHLVTKLFFSNAIYNLATKKNIWRTMLYGVGILKHGLKKYYNTKYFNKLSLVFYSFSLCKCYFFLHSSRLAQCRWQDILLCLNSEHHVKSALTFL